MYLLIYIILLVIPLIYIYLNSNLKYWSKRGVLGPKPIPVFGNALNLFIKTQVDQELNWFKRYGKIYGYYFGSKPILTVSDPELIKTILVKDFHIFHDRRQNISSLHAVLDKNLADATGDDWKRIRYISSPVFTSGKMKKMYPLIKECLNDFITHLDTYALDRKDINIKDIYGNYTLDVIATCVFATKINVHKKLDNPFVQNVKNIFDYNSNYLQMIAVMALPAAIVKLFKFNNFTNSARYFFISIAKNLMDNRRKTDEKYNDFVQLLIDADINSADNVIDNYDTNESHHVNEVKEELDIRVKSFKMTMVNKKMTEDEQISQLVLYLFAGYDTTATTLTYSIYELALQPQLQQRLADEVNGALDSNGDISYEELAKLVFLDAVVSETLRLHTVFYRLKRHTSTDYELGDTGIKLEKGQLVEIPVYAIHHAEEFYPEPFEFKPDRFMPENRHLIKPYTYLPFGAGPRNCIGMRFALFSTKVALAHTIRQYKFYQCNRTDVPLKKRMIYGSNVPKSVVVGIEKRI